jgi:hypothetical protein
MIIKRSLTCSQQPTTCSYSQLHHSSPYFFKFSLNIILPSASRSFPLLFPSGFPIRILYVFTFYFIRTACPARLIRLDLITRIFLGDECKSWSSLTGHFLQLPVTSPVLGPHIFLSAPRMNTLSLYSHINLRDNEAPNPYKKQVNLYFCTYDFVFCFDSETEDKRLWSITEFSLLVISSCMQFWLARVIPKYSNLAALSRYPLGPCMLQFCHETYIYISFYV